ncbi:MAG: thioredoxin family protein [Porphyrobacter sp.]|nr:thioredoxin family protein [Porphyrobacter sp.]
MIRAAIAASLALALAACVSVPDAILPEATPEAPVAAVPEASPHPEARSYAVSPDAMGDVDAALARAAANGKRVLVVLGANWCHDSRALAGWLETPRFAALVAERYELVFVNVGMPQTGDGHNLDVARRFGLDDVPGTPALLVLSPEGRALNLDTAASWRNAGSRAEDAIFAELAALAGS